MGKVSESWLVIYRKSATTGKRSQLAFYRGLSDHSKRKLACYLQRVIDGKEKSLAGLHP
jgi:hypothetical protein